MARLVKRFRKQPYAMTVGAETVSICGCARKAAPGPSSVRSRAWKTITPALAKCGSGSR